MYLLLFKFADDLCLIRIIYNNNDYNCLQNDLNKVFKFCNENSLKLNPLKCEHLCITYKKQQARNYYLNNICIKTIVNHKHIGIIYDTKMLFNSHIDMIIEKALKKYSILKFICNRVNGFTFLRLYFTYVLPILEFSNLSVMLTKSQSDRIELVQRKITKYICFKLSKSGLNYDQRLESLNISSLSKRRNIQILKTLFKVRYNLFECKQKWINCFVFYETSRNGIFCKLSKHKTICEKSFFINASNLFNSLPKDFRSETNLTKFLNNLQTFF